MYSFCHGQFPEQWFKPKCVLIDCARMYFCRLCCKTDNLQTLEREMEEQKKQHSVTVDKFLMQTQNLEAALKKERAVIVEER